VVVDQPAYYSGRVLAAATLPGAASSHNVLSSRHCRQGDAGLSPNLDLITYSETSPIVSPRRADSGRLRVPIQLADENSVLEIAEAFSPTSPLSLDSVDFIVEKVTDCTLSSATDSISNMASTAEAKSYTEVPKTTECTNSVRGGTADEQLYVNSLSEAVNDHLVTSRSLSTITEDARQTAEEFESYPEYDNFCRSHTSVDSFPGHGNGTDGRVSTHSGTVHPAYQVQPRSLQIGRCTTV